MADKKKPSGDYEVGYGKPPKSGQIKKGERRNPKGRPKGSKNFKTDLLEELGEMMRVREGDREHRISKQRALIKTQVARALNGNDRAAAKIIDLYLKVIGIEDAAADADLSLTEDERAVIEKLGERLRRRAALPRPRPTTIIPKTMEKGMSEFDRHDLEVALRQDLASFIQRSFQTIVPAADYLDNWHIDAIAWHLRQCFDGRIKRLIITLPPRNLKSICASVAFPAWVLGRDPTRRIICASYSNELTAKHARDCRAVMESPWYRSVFPRTRLNPKKSAELEFETTRQGYRYGTSLGGALTGRGGNFVIVDDPIKPADAMSDVRRESVKQWFDGTLYSRLDSKKDDVIIIVMQRVHVDDLVGHLLEKDADWVHLALPAVADAVQAVPIGPNEVYYR